MTERSWVWDGKTVGDAALAEYSATEWAAIWRSLSGIGSVYPNYGVIKGTGGGLHEPLAVLATTIPSANIEVQPGAALLRGRLYETDAVVTLTVGANNSGNPRIDTVVLRADFVLQTVRAAIRQGTPAPSPARPTLQQDSNIWEVPIADIAVANGFSTIVQSNITQRRRYANTTEIGWMPYAHPVGFSFVGSFSQSFTLNADGFTVVVPVELSGNMLLQRLRYVYAGGAVDTYTWGWDIYVQDLNDGNSAENVLRRVAQSNGNDTFGGGASLQVRTLDAQAAPVPLSPGLYWLAIQNRHATSQLPIKSSQVDPTLGITVCKIADTVNPNGSTLNFVTGGWVASTHLPQVQLEGRVFGQTTAFA